MNSSVQLKPLYDLIIVGAGPAGLSAALSAYQAGARDILICERDDAAGGILNQCIHSGFGLHYFREELTGPEYAARFVDELAETSVDLLLNTMVLSIDADPSQFRSTQMNASSQTEQNHVEGPNPLQQTQQHTVSFISRDHGYQELRTRTVVLAMGCRERSRAAIAIPGSRPSGVMTAGAAQRYVNIEGYLPGQRVVILGSGDIGLIMARRMTLEGAEVLACVELMPYSGGLARNIAQCLDDFDIPLLLSHTVTEIRGTTRLESVVVSRVDADRRPIPGSEIVYECDCLLLSVGLLPENELTQAAGIPIDPRTRGAYVYENMETGTAGIFACGNVVHVHDLVDFVSEESARAGTAAAAYALSQALIEDAAHDEISQEAGAAGLQPQSTLQTAQSHRSGPLPSFALHHSEQIAYTVPQQIHLDPDAGPVDVFFRVKAPMDQVEIQVYAGDKLLRKWPRLKLAPGEMEKITLQRSLLNEVRDNFLTLSLAKRGQTSR